MRYLILSLALGCLLVTAKPAQCLQAQETGS